METNNNGLFGIRATRKGNKSTPVKCRKELFMHARPEETNVSVEEVLRFLNDPHETIEHIVVTKSGTDPMQEFIIHYRPGCPNTARALNAIEKIPNQVRVIMHSADDAVKNRKLRAFLSKKHPDKPITYPRVFAQDGQLIGGATELIETLTNV